MAYQPIPVGGSGVQFLNSPFGDTTYTKVFVGGLAWETQSETLRRYFEQFGEILEAVVIADKHTGRSKGYGFVTFRDPEAAKKACADPSPVIDGRRANCNLASLGRPQPSLPYGRPRPTMVYFGSSPSPAGPYVGSPSYHQSLSYGYQPGLAYPPYGRYSPYGPEYAYPQGVYSPYVGQQYMQMYGVPSTSNTNIFAYGQMGHPPHSNVGYAPLQSYMLPGAHIPQFGRPSVVGPTTEFIPTTQPPYHTGVAAPTPRRARIMIPARPPQFIQNSASDQTAA